MSAEHSHRAGHGRYLFGFARNLDAASVRDAPSLGETALEVVTSGDLQAVVCDVDLAEFGEDALTENLENLEWLEHVARTHNEVVLRVGAAATVAPARLVTICANDASVRTRIDEQRLPLTEALDRVQGRSELSVKIYLRQQPGVASSGQDSDVTSAQATPAGSGAAYLRRKQEQARLRRDAGNRGTQVADTIDRALASRAVASRRLTPQDPQLTGRSEPMIANLAYLVPTEVLDGFSSLVEQLQVEHSPVVLLEAAGPWPPYSFATLD